MRHALANPVVDGDKGPLCLHTLFHGARQKLDTGKKWRNHARRQVGQGFVVFFRNQEAVPRKERPMVQKGQRRVIFEDVMAWHITVNDLAKEAVCVLRTKKVWLSFSNLHMNE